MNSEESQLVESLLSTDATQPSYNDIFTQVHSLIQPRLLAYALRLLRAHPSRHSMSEDVTQQVWIAAIEHLSTFDPKKGTFVTWLYAITRHLVISTVRGNAVTRRTISGSPTACDVSDNNSLKVSIAFENAAYSAYIKERKRMAVSDAVDDMLTRLLPDDQREVLILTMNGCDVPTGASITGMSERTFKRRRQSALARLRRDQSHPLPASIEGPSINWQDIQMMVA